MLNKVKKTEFTKNVITLMMGTTVAQALPIIISPILTRLYTPEDFGVFALFLSITAILSSVSNARYELAIMLPDKDEDAINVFSLCIIISFFFSILLYFILLVFNDYFINKSFESGLDYWIYLVPIAVFFIGIFNALNYFNTRKKNYKDISKAVILKSITLSVIQLLIGFIKGGPTGLVFGEIVSRMVANGKLIKNIVNDKRMLSNISIFKILEMGKKYIEFPMFSMWAILANTASRNITSIFISFFYTVTSLGFYSLTEKVLGVPTSLIGKSIGQVYFQQSSDEYKVNNTVLKTFKNTLKKLLIIAVPVFLIIYLIIEEVFVIVFGENWAVAGEYAQILSFLYFCRFIVVPLAITPMVLNKVKIDLYFQLGMFTLIISFLIFSYFFNVSIYEFFYLFSYLYGLYYLLYLLFLYFYIKRF